MNTALSKAKSLLEQGKFTCVILKDNEIFTSTQRGIAPLLQWLDSGIDFSGAVAADKVVGRGAAFLYVLLGVSQLYTPVVSRPALEILNTIQIETVSDCQTDAIRNRAGTGFCPMERAVWEIHDPQEALTALRKRAEELKRGSL